VPGEACRGIGSVACGRTGPIDHPRPVPPDLSFGRRVYGARAWVVAGHQWGCREGASLALHELDSRAAFALLLGLGATTTTADPISAILFGVPGHAASAATTLDPLTRQGQGGRALGAPDMSALMGGLFGAALMGLSLPVLGPAMLYIGPPELLAFAVFGISMVAALSGSAPLRGLADGCFGVMLSMIGAQTGTQRWTFDNLFLSDGLPLVPIVLGIFALPELCDLVSDAPPCSPAASQSTPRPACCTVSGLWPAGRGSRATPRGSPSAASEKSIESQKNPHGHCVPRRRSAGRHQARARCGLFRRAPGISLLDVVSFIFFPSLLPRFFRRRGDNATALKPFSVSAALQWGEPATPRRSRPA
jgi:hypothetical protein